MVNESSLFRCFCTFNWASIFNLRLLQNPFSSSSKYAGVITVYKMAVVADMLIIALFRFLIICRRVMNLWFMIITLTTVHTIYCHRVTTQMQLVIIIIIIIIIRMWKV